MKQGQLRFPREGRKSRQGSHFRQSFHEMANDPCRVFAPLLMTQSSEQMPHLSANRALSISWIRNCHLRRFPSSGNIVEIPMTMFSRIPLLLCGLLVLNGNGRAQDEGEQKFVYTAPVVQKVLFDDSVGIFEQERKDFASNLAVYAANNTIAKKASEESLEDARRILALALHLDRRNREAMIINGQLRRGVLPEIKKADYNPRSFSRLLLARAKLLRKNNQERQKLLARCFIELAAMIDPRNEDAVFEYENQLIDDGEIDWRLLTEAAKPKPSRSPAPSPEGP